MKVSNDNTSLWESSIPPLRFNKLNEDIETEILIIGGGISGITTAYNLLKAGKKVVVIEEAAALASGQTINTTGHLTACLDVRYFQLEEQIGKEKTLHVANSHMAAIEWIDRTIRVEKINCNFKRVNGYLYSSNQEIIQKEYLATQRLGLITQLLNKVPEIQLAEKNNCCIRFPEQAQLHILQYLRGLTAAIIRMGAEIYTRTRAERIAEHEVTANNFKIKAEHIVITVNTDFNSKLLTENQTLIRSYVIALKVPKGRFSYSLWWELGPEAETQTYYYARLEEYDDLYDILLVGGEDTEISRPQEKENEEMKYNTLHKWATKRFNIDNKMPEYKWSGIISYPNDGLAYIGNFGNKNIYIITGDSGNGINYATLGSGIITDSICGRKNEWESIYTPGRLRTSLV